MCLDTGQTSWFFRSTNKLLLNGELRLWIRHFKWNTDQTDWNFKEMNFWKQWGTVTSVTSSHSCTFHSQMDPDPIPSVYRNQSPSMCEMKFSLNFVSANRIGIVWMENVSAFSLAQNLDLHPIYHLPIGRSVHSFDKVKFKERKIFVSSRQWIPTKTFTNEILTGYRQFGNWEKFVNVMVWRLTKKQRSMICFVC